MTCKWDLFYRNESNCRILTKMLAATALLWNTKEETKPCVFAYMFYCKDSINQDNSNYSWKTCFTYMLVQHVALCVLKVHQPIQNQSHARYGFLSSIA